MRKNILFFCLINVIAINLFAQKVDPCDGKGDCIPLPFPIPEVGLGDMASMIIRQAVDPNELEGPIGVDSVRWVSKNDVLNYTVFFENDPAFATAHAQIVDIHIDLPYEQLLNDFTLGTYAFANKSYEVPNESNFYSIRLDTRDSLDIYVDVLAGLDVENKQAFWRLASIDPESGHAPWQVDRGILPVNDSTHIGEGFVTFRLKPFEEMQTGDSIVFHANIVFDSSDTLQTNRWSNIIDAGAPTSKIKALVDQENYSHYMLSFEAEDDLNGSGVNRVLLYLADNLGTYEEYATCAVDSVLDFYVERGKQYSFMSIAQDRVGNSEGLKSKPDLILNFNEPPTDLILSNDRFQDDIALDGFIGELSTIDSEGETFTYELAEGEGAIHNEMFAIKGSQLIANDCFKCSNETEFSIRLSTTDEGGLSFSKPFKLYLERVLEQPEPVIFNAEICEGDFYEFFGEEYDNAGEYHHRVANEFMCDSVYVLRLSINPIPEAPTVTISDKATLTSSAERGNQWYKDDMPIDGATEQVFTATETGLYYVTASNSTCESEPSAEYYVNLDEVTELNISLEKGWNWISSNIAEPTLKAPGMFFASIIDNLLDVRSSNGGLTNEDGNLVGDISSIDPETYKLSMSSSDELKLKGDLVKPEDFQLTLNPGWNWIPYIPVIEMDIDAALADYSPVENDVLKSHTQFAIYSNGKWTGTLNKMQPNYGYMYFSVEPTILSFSPTRAHKIVKEPIYMPQISSPWHCDATLYADNQTMIAKISDDGVEVIEGAYLIGAFCNDECRGIGEYIDGKLFLMIHGNPYDAITFKAIENVTNKERDVKNDITFDGNHIGTIDNPYLLILGIDSSIDNVYSDNLSSYALNIYPNPVRDILFIEGDVTDVTRIKIITVSGITILSTESYENGINVTSIQDGVYVVAIMTHHGVIYREFIKKGY